MLKNHKARVNNSVLHTLIHITSNLMYCMRTTYLFGMEFSLELSKFYVWAKYLFCRIEQYSNAVLYYRCCNSKCNVNIDVIQNKSWIRYRV